MYKMFNMEHNMIKPWYTLDRTKKTFSEFKISIQRFQEKTYTLQWHSSILYTT